MAKKYYLYMLFSVQSQIFTKSSDVSAGETGVVLPCVTAHSSGLCHDLYHAGWQWVQGRPPMASVLVLVLLIFCSSSLSLFWILFYCQEFIFHAFFFQLPAEMMDIWIVNAYIRVFLRLQNNFFLTEQGRFQPPVIFQAICRKVEV